MQFSRLFLFCSCLLIINENIVVSQTTNTQDNFDVTFYELDVHVNDSNTLISGIATVGFQLLEDSDSITLNLGQNLTPDSIQLNGEETGFVHTMDLLKIEVSNLDPEEHHYVKVHYEGDGNHPHEYGAIFNSRSRHGNFTYTLTEPFAAKYWFPCKEILADKADSVFVYITIPKGLKAGSNGLLKNVVEIDNEHVQYQWETFYPTAFYLISFALGDYIEYNSEIKLEGLEHPLPVINYVYKTESFLKNNKEQIDATIDMLHLYSELFGKYPFHEEKYGHCIVPIGGGMEHQTMTTIGYFDFELVAHELAHQWFGNQVTCQYWNDIWINEGFASYGEYIALEELDSEDRAQAWLRYAQDLTKDYSEGSVYVPADEVGISARIFDYRLSYKKGAVIIHMIRQRIDNDALFYSILKEFLVRFNFGTATGDDFRHLLEERTDLSFEDFFNEWYYGHGYPLIGVDWYQLGDTLFVVNKQSVTAPEKTPFFHLKFEYLINTSSDNHYVYHDINEVSDTLEIYLPEKVLDLHVDPNHNLLAEILDVRKIIDPNSIEQQVLLYPNPASEYVAFYSKMLTSPVDLTFFDSYGSKVKFFNQISPKGAQLPIGELNSGVYHVYLDAKNYSNVYKVIIK